MITLDDVNEALGERNESDVPLNDKYWDRLNSYRHQKALEVQIILEPVPEKLANKPPIPVADIPEPKAEPDILGFSLDEILGNLPNG